MYLQGYSQGNIAKHLTSLGIDTPKKYKGQNAKINEWRNDTISRILKDPIYTGQMVINKYNSDYRTKKNKKTPREKWILIDGKYEPLVSKEEYEQVQQMLKDKFIKPTQKYDYLLRDLVFCGHCKSRMQYKYRTRTKIRDKILENPQKCWYYKCRMLYKFPSICKKKKKNIQINFTPRHNTPIVSYTYIVNFTTFVYTIQEKKLNDIVVESLKNRLSRFKIDDYTGNIIDEYKENDTNFKYFKQYQKKKKKLESNITALYNRKLENLITIDEFREQYSNLKQEIKDVELKISELERLSNPYEMDEKLKELIIDFKKGKEFTNEIIKELIERIEVYEDMKIDIVYKV